MQKFHADFMELMQRGREAPELEENFAKENVQNFKTLKVDIESGVALIQERIDSVKKQITDNLQTDQNADGLLTQKSSSYLSCFELDLFHLKDALESDEIHWNQQLSQAQESRAKS